MILFALSILLADHVYVPICLPPTTDTVEVCIWPEWRCEQTPKGRGRGSVFVHGDKHATVYVRALSQGEPVLDPAPLGECNEFANYRHGVWLIGPSMRLGSFRGPRERTWSSARENQRGIPFPIDNNSDGRITPADLAVIDDYMRGLLPDDVANADLCINADCPPNYPPPPPGELD